MTIGTGRLKLHLVQLGVPILTAGYRRDNIAQHWWIDAWFVRVCVTRRVRPRVDVTTFGETNTQLRDRGPGRYGQTDRNVN